MLKVFQTALVVCAAIAAFVGGAHVTKTYAEVQLASAVKAIVAADAASKPVMPDPPSEAYLK